MTVLTKSQYATRIGVSPQAVTNYIARGKLRAPALRLDGKIEVELADELLGRSLAPVEHASAMARSAKFVSPQIEAAAQQLLRARAVMASVAAERARRELLAERGRYMLTAEAEARWAKVLGDFLLQVEQSLPDLAAALGLGHDQLVTLRRWWRARRLEAAESNRVAAAAEPEFIEDTAV